MKKFLTLFVVLATFFAPAQMSGQITITLEPEQDNTMFQVPNIRSNGAGQEIYTGTVNNGSLLARRALLQFSFDAIPDNAIITDVNIQLYCFNASQSGNSSTYTFHRLLESWGEAGSVSPNGQGVLAEDGDATWRYRFYDFDNGIEWFEWGGTYTDIQSATRTVASANAFYTWSDDQLVQDVQFMLENPTENFGWILKSTGEEVGGLGRAFGSRENLDAEKRPLLTVSYILPTSVTDLNKTDSWTCYPNPGNEVLVIQNGQNEMNQPFQIVDMGGRVIHEGHISDYETFINTAAWPSGTYVIRFLNDTRKSVWVKE